MWPRRKKTETNSYNFDRIYVTRKAIHTHQMSIIFNSRPMAVFILCAVKIATQIRWMCNCNKPNNSNQISSSNNNRPIRLTISVITTIHTTERPWIGHSYAGKLFNQYLCNLGVSLLHPRIHIKHIYKRNRLSLKITQILTKHKCFIKTLFC